MKKILVVFAVLVLTLAAVTPAVAAGSRHGYANGSVDGLQYAPVPNFLITGKITEIGADYVVVKVIRGNSLVHPYIGTLVTLTVTPTTRYLFTDGVTTVKITFADLKVDQKISAYGTFMNDTWLTKRITVGAKLKCLP